MLDVDGIDADPNAVELRVLSELPELLSLGLLGPLAARPEKREVAIDNVQTGPRMFKSFSVQYHSHHRYP